MGGKGYVLAIFQFRFSSFQSASATEERSNRSIRLQSKSDERWAMYSLLQDLRYGLRMMRKSPGFTAVVLIVLALGIGGNTAIFSVVNGVLLQPLPYPRAEQLVSIRSAEPSRGIPPVVASYADYLDWKQQALSFSNMGAYVFDAFNLSAGEKPIQVEAVDATTSALRTLGTVPELGR